MTEKQLFFHRIIISNDKSNSLPWVQHYSANRFLMVGQSGSSFPSNEIPEPDSGIMTPCGIDKKTLWQRQGVEEWCVFRRSQHTQKILWQTLPVMICGSAFWHFTVATVLVWPVSVWTLALVLISQTWQQSRWHLTLSFVNPQCHITKQCFQAYKKKKSQIQRL